MLFHQDSVTVLDPELQNRLEQLVGSKFERVDSLHAVGASLVLTSTPTNHLNVQPEYKTNMSGTHWFALTIQSNRLMNGALETFCGLPAGDFVFIRIRSAR